MSNPIVDVTAEAYANPGDQFERALEDGRILRFEPGMLPLPSEDDLNFLREEVGALITLKNISYHPDGDYITGMKKVGDTEQRLRAILRNYSDTVNSFLGAALPHYAVSWHQQKVNFRPVQEKGRQIKRHSNNELLHVDAFPAGATHGRRPLRFFTNINTSEPRIWRIAEQFDQLYAAYAKEAGIDTSMSVRGNAAERAWSGALAGLARLGLPQLQVIGDTSPYDRAMRKMHNWMKDNDAFQQDPGRGEELAFQPFESWAVMTDAVSHAALSGQHALVATYYVELDACRLPERAPYNVVARGADQAA
ncbi:Kdo hydroxylase family protein [Methylonatrum kenyense]|uniref:Kdo hydroxylase family protein n=1 Tax=Methylonatrum kenyense TaxID=455253 RepID=UPI0020C072EE|nr:Kdo hydroxylase family protein [Methylonatrum kenyense]MCK8516948.1 Kdo hydroxylase family protein [Methylonatrum kenyense]